MRKGKFPGSKRERKKMKWFVLIFLTAKKSMEAST